MKINHFPNISLDISETKEKYLTEKNERIIEELCQVLVEELPYSVTMMHGQDHLMTTVLLKDVIYHLIELYKRGAK